MPSLKEVRNRINSVRSTQQITKAMKMVAAAKLRKAQDNILQMRPYSQRLQGILNNVIASEETQAEDNPFAAVRSVNRVLVVVITSDRGLCGSFNSNVVKTATALIDEKYADQKKAGGVSVMCIGRRGRDFFKRRNYQVIEDYTELFHALRFDQVRAAAEYAMHGFVNKQFDQVEVVYNEFKNVATQIVRANQFLPLLPSSPTAAAKAKEASNTDYLYEPNKAVLVQELLPKSLKITFYKSLLESFASEHGARMTAMDKATENAGELLKELKLTYNRSRQASITKEILEIVGGAEALANG
jgi:F-type H+-transporting ATPase subunit gamma